MNVRILTKEMTPEEEGKIVRDIMTFLSNDFFDNDSFNDLQIFN